MRMDHVLLLFCVALFVPTYCYRASEVTLSPESWPKEVFDRLERFNLLKDYNRPKPLAYSDGKGVIAGTTNAFAVHAGVDALKKGGNAMDACLATALAGISS